MEAVDHLLGVFDVDDVVEVVKLLYLGFEDIVDQTQRVDRLEITVVARLVQLAHVCLGGIEEHALHESVGPVHLHFHKELPSKVVLAAHVDNRVLLQWGVGYKLRGQKLHGLYLLPLLEGQQSIEKAGGQVGVLTENLLERKVRAWIQIS